MYYGLLIILSSREHIQRTAGGLLDDGYLRVPLKPPSVWTIGLDIAQFRELRYSAFEAIRLLTQDGNGNDVLGDAFAGSANGSGPHLADDPAETTFDLEDSIEYEIIGFLMG